MNEVVSAYTQDIQFIIGMAGTGKSTKILELSDEHTLLLTPTHKAVKVLLNKGLVNVFTIHSVLKLVPTLNQNFRRGQRMQTLKQIGDTDLSTINKVIIDEYSMISTDILDLLLEVLPKQAKVIVVGDQYQLPPVQGQAIEPEDYTDNIVELTTQHRAEAPHIVETFTRMANYVKGLGNDLTLNKAITKGTLKDFNPDTDIALAYTNDKVIEINDEIAKHLKLKPNLSIGDELLFNQLQATLSDEGGIKIYPACVSKGKLLEDDELFKKLVSLNANINKFRTVIPYETMKIQHNDNRYVIHYDYDYHNTQKALKDKVEKYQFKLIEYHKLSEDVNLTQWCKFNKEAKYVKERGKAWSEYLTHQNYVFSVRRPYALTVHKSQGSEYSTVYLAQDDLKKCIKGNYYEQYARLMYVALSRAIKNVIIIN